MEGTFGDQVYGARHAAIPELTACVDLLFLGIPPHVRQMRMPVQLRKWRRWLTIGIEFQRHRTGYFSLVCERRRHPFQTVAKCSERSTAVGRWRLPVQSTDLGIEEQLRPLRSRKWPFEPWSNGKVGLNGISYYGQNQWQTSALQPKHLAAICIWEGAVDFYRDMAHHGGIFNRGFVQDWSKAQVYSVQNGRGTRGFKSRINGDWVSGPETLSEEQLGRNRRDFYEDCISRNDLLAHLAGRHHAHAKPVIRLDQRDQRGAIFRRRFRRNQRHRLLRVLCNVIGGFFVGGVKPWN